MNELVSLLDDLSIVSSVSNKFDRTLAALTEAVKKAQEELNNICADDSLELTELEKIRVKTIGGIMIKEAYLDSLE